MNRFEYGELSDAGFLVNSASLRFEHLEARRKLRLKVHLWLVLCFGLFLALIDLTGGSSGGCIHAVAMAAEFGVCILQDGRILNLIQDFFVLSY